MWTAISLVVAWSLFPFWWGFVYSFKPPAHLFDATLLPLLQFSPTLEHWQVAWEGDFRQDGMGEALLNGIAVDLGTALVAVVVGLPAAVGLARFPPSAASGRGTRRALPAAACLAPRRNLPAGIAAGVEVWPVRHQTRPGPVRHGTRAAASHSGAPQCGPGDPRGNPRGGTAGWNGLVGLLWHFILPLLRPAVLAVGFPGFAVS